MSNPRKNEFQRAAEEPQRGGLIRELWGFLNENKKWWLLPILLTLLVLGLLIFLSSTAAAPFIYTLF